MQVYLITNVANGKVYVGQTSKSARERWREHIRSSRRGREGRIYSAMRKWGLHGFDVCTLRLCSSIEEMNRLEQLFIVLFRANDRNFGYNIGLGGHGGNMSEETKKKISDRAMGRIAHNKGKPMSAEQKAKLSAAKVGLPAWNKGIKTGPTGKPKPGTSEAGKRRWQNPEYRAKGIADLNRVRIGTRGKVAWNRGVKRPRTHCSRGHELTPENIYVRTNGNLLCKICNKLAYKMSYRPKAKRSEVNGN